MGRQPQAAPTFPCPEDKQLRESNSCRREGRTQGKKRKVGAELRPLREDEAAEVGASDGAGGRGGRGRGFGKQGVPPWQAEHWTAGEARDVLENLPVFRLGGRARSFGKQGVPPWQAER